MRCRRPRSRQAWLGATRAIWRGVVAELEVSEMRGLVPDLLGIGGSRQLGTQLELRDQVDALAALLERHNGPPLIVVGHSFAARSLSAS